MSASVGFSVGWLVGLLEFPQKGGSYTSILLSEHLSIFNYLLIRISCCGHRLPRLRERDDQYQAEDPVINNNSNNNNNNKYKISTATNRKRHNLYMWKILRVWALDLQRSEVKPQKGKFVRHLSRHISLFGFSPQSQRKESVVGCFASKNCIIFEIEWKKK